ncbi:MAG: DinB family protein [Chloroflexi bacterium]|nr:DinB family protein [Chloroflexota bacterium]
MNSLARVKRDLIAGLDERRSEARAFVQTLPPTLSVHADSDWTARDLIIHLTAIEADMITALHCAIEGEPFAVDLRGGASVKELYELRRRDKADLSWGGLLAEWDRVRDQLRGVLLAFPPALMERRFDNPFFQPYTLIEAVRACSAHEARHLAEIRAAAESNS